MERLAKTQETEAGLLGALEALGLCAEDREAIAPLAELCSCVDGESMASDAGGIAGARLLVDGELLLSHRGVAFARLGPGRVFDAIGAIAPGGVPSFDAVAQGPCRVANFPPAALEDLGARRPDVALRFERLLARRFASELRELASARTAPFETLLFPEPELHRARTVIVTIDDRPVEAATGVTAETLLPRSVDGALVVAATVDRHVASLSTRITSSCTLSPVTTGSIEGRRIHRRSLGLLTIEAAHRARPEARVRSGPSVGFGRLLYVEGVADISTFAGDVQARLAELVAEDAPLREEWWSVLDARRRFLEQNWTEAARLLDHLRMRAVPLVTYGERVAFSVGAMYPRSGPFGGATLRTHADGLLLLPPPDGREPVEAGDVPTAGSSWDRTALAAADHVTRITAAPRRWMLPLGLSSLADLNRHGIVGTIGEVVQVAEGAHEKQLSDLAERVLDGDRRPHLVCIAGPTSSGKSTVVRRLAVQLRVAGLAPVVLSIDDYFKDRDETPRDPAGRLDFESPDALRRELLQGQLARLLAGEETRTAAFDFLTGRSEAEGGPALRLGENGLVLLEGLHALNPGLLGELSDSGVHRVYVAPMTSLPIDDLTRIPASDLRLLRRIVRDRAQRGLTAAETIERWSSVRRGERLHVFPHQEHADSVFDTSLVYEPAVLKVRAERCLLEVPKEHASYPAAYRLLQLLDLYVAVEPDDVPRDSLLREFLGGGWSADGGGSAPADRRWTRWAESSESDRSTYCR